VASYFTRELTVETCGTFSTRWSSSALLSPSLLCTYFLICLTKSDPVKILSHSTMLERDLAIGDVSVRLSHAGINSKLITVG